MGKLPSLDSVLRSIEILQNEKWPTFDAFGKPDDYLKYFQEKFVEHFNHKMFYLSVPLGNLSYKFYRVRSFDEIKNPEAVKEYSYPPSEYCQQNRANLPGFPVFYSSPNPGIALLEAIRAKGENIGKEYCLTLWNLNQEKEFIITPFIYGIQNKLYKELAENVLNQKLTEIFKDTHYSVRDQESFKEIMRYLSNAFVQDDEKKYSISSFIGHSHMYMPHTLRTDLFIYPSIQSSLNAINIAINPDTADKYLEMKYMLRLKVTELDLENNYVKIETSHYGICNGHTIQIKPTGDLEKGLDPVYEGIFPEFAITG